MRKGRFRRRSRGRVGFRGGVRRRRRRVRRFGKMGRRRGRAGRRMLVIGQRL